MITGPRERDPVGAGVNLGIGAMIGAVAEHSDLTTKELWKIADTIDVDEIAAAYEGQPMTQDKPLRISQDLSMPLAAVTQTFAILAKRGAGKSYTAMVIAEEMIKAGLQLVAIDPVGVWWGLRASHDGEEEGLPIAVIGGDHGDIPLHEDSGTAVADLIVDETVSAVIDLSHLRKHDQRDFVTSFNRTLYHKNRTPIHVFYEESDIFAPQKGGERDMSDSMEDIFRRGRTRGIGGTLISQRPAVVDKDVLTQAEVLIALRMTGPQDQKAIDDWVKHHGDTKQRDRMLEDLAALPTGTAYVWSPGWLGTFSKIQVRERETYDSSATPEPGQEIKPPKHLASIDLSQLQATLETHIEKARERDPDTLKARIRDLERELAKAKAEADNAPDGDQDPEVRVETETVTETIVEEVEVPILTDDHVQRLEGAIGTLHDEDLGRLEQAAKTVHEATEAAREAVTTIQEAILEADTEIEPKRIVKKGTLPTARRVDQGLDVPDDAPEPDELGPRHVRVLKSVAELKIVGITRPEREQVALWADYSPTSGTFNNYLSRLKSMGLIAYPQPGLVSLTGKGAAIVGDQVDPPASIGDWHDRVLEKLSASHARILDVLIDHYPDVLDREEVAEESGYRPTSGTFNNYLGRLRTYGLIVYPEPGRVQASKMLFLENGD